MCHDQKAVMGKMKRERRSDVAAAGLCAFFHSIISALQVGVCCLLLVFHRLLVFNLASK